MAWANKKVIPASCADLDRGEIKAELIARDGNISAAAKALGVPAPDLRKLVWATDLADMVFEQIEQGLDEAHGGVAGGAFRPRQDAPAAGGENLADPNRRRAAARLGRGDSRRAGGRDPPP